MKTGRRNFRRPKDRKHKQEKTGGHITGCRLADNSMKRQGEERAAAQRGQRRGVPETAKQTAERQRRQSGIADRQGVSDGLSPVLETMQMESRRYCRPQTNKAGLVFCLERYRLQKMHPLANLLRPLHLQILHFQNQPHASGGVSK